MDNKTVLIAVMAGIVILLSGFVIGASLNSNETQNDTQLSLNNTTMNSSYTNDSPDTTTTNTNTTTTTKKKTTNSTKNNTNTNTSTK
jgi:hypothetical protein